MKMLPALLSVGRRRLNKQAVLPVHRHWVKSWIQLWTGTNLCTFGDKARGLRS